VTAGEAAERLGLMQAEGRVVLVAELDGAVVGCLSTSVMRVLHRPAPVGRISMMVVEEALRGLGIGAALVRAAERALAERGCYMVEVTSNVRRTEAHRFYERLGYERTSVRLAMEL
jgi:GNAT superfamily N-acetyltransferase